MQALGFLCYVFRFTVRLCMLVNPKNCAVELALFLPKSTKNSFICRHKWIGVVPVHQFLTSHIIACRPK